MDDNQEFFSSQIHNEDMQLFQQKKRKRDENKQDLHTDNLGSAQFATSFCINTTHSIFLEYFHQSQTYVVPQPQIPDILQTQSPLTLSQKTFIETPFSIDDLGIENTPSDDDIFNELKASLGSNNGVDDDSIKKSNPSVPEIKKRKREDETVVIAKIVAKKQDFYKYISSQENINKNWEPIIKPALKAIRSKGKSVEDDKKFIRTLYWAYENPEIKLTYDTIIEKCGIDKDAAKKIYRRYYDWKQYGTLKRFLGELEWAAGQHNKKTNK
ncbi:MAG: hypothetical protein HYS39_03410 [Proteobacteria bacterium]|nr:hypothetical protein [Pseudomonadota bacterium]